MISIRELYEEIDRLEADDDPSYSTIEKLHMLYGVRDHMQIDRRQSPIPEYSYASDGASEFLQATEGVPMEHILEVLDGHMTAIKALYPKEYRSILRKIRQI